MYKEISENIKSNPFGEKTETIIINGSAYKLNCQWNKRITINIDPKHSLITEKDVSEIRKLPLISIIFRSPQYSICGIKTPLTKKLLLNQYTRALLYFRASRIKCQNNQISYTAQLRKKNSAQLETIIEYFEQLIITNPIS